MKTLAGASIAVVVIVGALAVPSLHSQVPRCQTSPNIPLPDLARSYRGIDFGLYPGRRTTPPNQHLIPGLERARKGVRPLDASGNPSPAGKIILMSLGMSNTSSEFSRFSADAKSNAAINRRLTILNGSLSGADAAMWTVPNSPPWQRAISIAGTGGNSAKQVQVIWVKQAHLRTAVFPDEVALLKADLESILRIAKSVFPNLQIAYLSSRTRAGAQSRRGPGEPQAYETAFAVRGAIQDQIEGRLGMDVAGWISWGPYLWSNGSPRSDGFVWDCQDVRQDMIHPTDSGDSKVAEQLMAFFMTADTSVPWFLEPQGSRAGPGISAIVPSTATGDAPLAVDFTAAVSEATRYFWSFEDGTSSTARNPRKTFYVDGVYHVRLTVTDALGRWAGSSVVVRVGRAARKSPS
jgi:PKD domain